MLSTEASGGLPPADDILFAYGVRIFGRKRKPMNQLMLPTLRRRGKDSSPNFVTAPPSRK
ncbi:hypothetical protein FRUB_05636 [Fimbriiglobus ruber]|uniref:Uncharacterized protein n=1 Tax=Fimbriiglobus ruber TaxID=1908690 RepID=A0A225DQC4_9BACT|nr:hypothetical protein FRUB_05636 [Fimbriiglobus ruber]